MPITGLKNVLNENLYDNSNIEVQYYQLRKLWPWRRGGVHALGWVLFAGGLLLIFGLLNLHDILLDRRRLGYTLAKNTKDTQGDQFRERSLFDRILLHLRSFGYLRSSRRRIGATSFGLGLLILVGFAYPTIYVFAQRPYYEMAPEFGPPPISGRSGMITLAMTPFVLMLGMKANLISLVTGVGHEKLNVLHRWLGFFMAFFAVVHTIPFIVEPLRHGGRERLWYLFSNHFEYWTGVGALACLLWLCFASLPFIRRWCYEVFVHLHIVCGIGYVGLLFWHCGNMLTSWQYLYVTVGLWLAHLAYRFSCRTNWFGPRMFRGDRATLTALTNNGVKVTIPTRMRWRAGQHVFLRIPSISLLDNHPFTVASVMQEKGEGNDFEYNDLVLVFKPHKGFTKQMYDLSRSMPDFSLRAFLDGPYGGLSRKLEAFETVLMIAGGSGITPIVAHLQHLVQKVLKGEALTRDIRIVWTVKDFDSLEWFKDEISAAARALPRNMLLCQYYATDETPIELPKHPVSATREWPQTPTSPTFRRPPPALIRPASDEFDKFDFGMHAIDKELRPSNLSGLRPEGHDPFVRAPSPMPPLGDEVLLEFGRPPLRDGLRPWSSTFGKRTCIYVCGPEGMKIDVANAVADMQPDIWACKQREEVYLHCETFGW